MRVVSQGVDEMSLAQARFLRMLVVRGHPGEEPPSSAGFTPSIVYQVTSGLPGGTPGPAFLIFQTMTAFAAMPMPGVIRGEIVEDLVYVVEPEMSHVSREFARQGGAFWLRP